MKIENFSIGTIFFYEAGGKWKCTDVGSRTITAIQLDLVEGDDSDWFKGPPYAVKEIVFNERELGFCYTDSLSRIENKLNKEFSDKPIFSAEARGKITKMYSDFKLLFFDFEIFTTVRVGPNGEVYQPITPNVNQEAVEGMSQEEKRYLKYNYNINIYELFTGQFYSMPVKNFLKFRAATEKDYTNRKRTFSENT